MPVPSIRKIFDKIKSSDNQLQNLILGGIAVILKTSFFSFDTNKKGNPSGFPFCERDI